MAFNDPIAEMLTKIRNAKEAQHKQVDMGFSKINVRILEILREHGYIENFLVNESLRKMRVFLRYNKDRTSVIRNLKRISTCGLRRYIGVDDIPKKLNVLNGMGIAILTTSKGVLEGKAAYKLRVGGEILCTVW